MNKANRGKGCFMKKELKKSDLEKVLQSECITELSFAEMDHLFKTEKGLADFAPDGECRIDPRDGSMIVFNPKRTKRPHDNRSEQGAPQKENKPCPICEGNTTGIIDVAELSEGFTFINKNLFPCVYPFERMNSQAACVPETTDSNGISYPALRASGFHFLQWTSSLHEKNWTNMMPSDLEIVLERLGSLEKKMLEGDNVAMPDTSKWHNGRSTRGFVSIIKNVGAAVGGSLTHDHQQIVYSDTMPTQTFCNWQFGERHNVCFSQYILDVSPPELILKDFGAATALVPYFMKRPLYTLLALKDESKQFLFELNAQERAAIIEVWSTLSAAFTDILPRMGRNVAYNILVHTGPGAGIYLEFLPYTQETGGYEHLGLWVCQSDPKTAATLLRDYFSPPE